MDPGPKESVPKIINMDSAIPYLWPHPNPAIIVEESNLAIHKPMIEVT